MDRRCLGDDPDRVRAALRRARGLDREVHMHGLTRILVMAAVIAPASNAMGQTQGEGVAYAVLVSTPTAGVTPVAREWMLSEPHPGIGVDVRWGHLSGVGGHIDTFTGGVTIPIAQGHGDVGLSAGYFKPSCDGGSCDGNFIAGGTVEGRVIQSQMQSATFTLGINGNVGFAKPSGGTLWSASAGMPLSVAFGNKGGMQIVPFVTPAIGWGDASGGGSSDSGIRFLTGGGIGVMSASTGVGFNVGVQKVFISGGRILFGAGFTWSRR
jgi:hypothetical protein